MFGFKSLVTLEKTFMALWNDQGQVVIEMLIIISDSLLRTDPRLLEMTRMIRTLTEGDALSIPGNRNLMKI